jgi:hypothetical protein
MTSKIRLALGLLALLVGGCESDPDRSASTQFGASVRNTIALQTASPTSIGPGLDAVKSQQVLRVYRADVAQPKKVEQPIIFSLGGGGSGSR